MHQAITFDLWETLIADTPSIDKKRTRYRVSQIRKILADEGIQVSVIELSQAHQMVWNHCLKKWARAVDIPFTKQVGIFLELTRPGLSKIISPKARNKIENIYARAALLYPPRMIKGADQVLRELSKDKYKLGLICNTGRTPGFVLRKLLHKFRLLKYFDVTLFSDETIVRKPDPKIFRLALKALNCHPSRALHVGDDLKNDVRGAMKAGMQAVWVEQPGKEAPEKVTRIKSVAGLPRHLINFVCQIT